MEIREQKIGISTGTIIRFFLVGILFFGAFILKGLLLVVLMSVVIASSIEPAATWMTRRRIPRLLSVILIYLCLAVLLVGIVFFLLIPLLSESTNFLQNFSLYFNAETLTNSIEHNTFLSSQPLITGLKNSIDLEQVIVQINTVISGITSNTFNTVATVFGGILSFVLMVVLSFYLSVEEDGIGKFLRIITPLKHERYVESLWRRAQRKIGLWMQGQLILAVIIGVLVYLGLQLLSFLFPGIHNILLLSFLAAAFEIIPLFGPILASIPAIALAFAGGGFTPAVLVAALYLIVHQFENQLIYPVVVKKVVGVSPVVSIIALVAGWELLGFLGLILAVPIATVVIEFFEDLERDKVEKIERMGTTR